MNNPMDSVASVEPMAVPLHRLLLTLRRHLWVLVLTLVSGVWGTADASVEAYRLSHGLGNQMPDQTGNTVGSGHVQPVNRQPLASTEKAAELGLSTLEAQARATRNIYESSLSRAAEPANVAGILESDASLVSAAEVPLSPSASQPARLLAVAAVLSIVLGTWPRSRLGRLSVLHSLPGPAR